MLKQCKKVVFIGGSCAIFLPVAWWRTNQIDKNKKVIVLWNSNRIIIEPLKKEEKGGEK